MKRWIGMVLVLLLVLSGCGQKPEQTTKRDPVEFSEGNVVHHSNGGVSRVEVDHGQAQDHHGESAPQGATAEDMLVSYCDQEIRYVDHMGTQYDCKFQVPLVNLNSDDAYACNMALQELADAVIADAQEAAKTHSGLVNQGISYEAWVQDRMLVLLVTVEHVWDCNRYLAYTFDLDSGELLDHSGVASRLGYSPDDLEAKLAQGVEREYRETYEGMEEMDARFYTIQLDRCLEADNLSQAQLYPDQTGKLMVVANIYSLTGEDSYIHNFPLEG